MTRIYIVRHAQTEDNINGIIQGQTDSPLTEYGIMKSQATARYLKDKNIQIIISSPLGRAYSTAKMIQKEINVANIIVDHSFMEIDLKPWEKKLKSEIIKDKSISGYFTYKNTPHLFSPSEGEDLYMLQKRVVAGLNKLIEIYVNTTIVLVSHNVSIRSLLIALQNLNLENIWTEYKLPPSSVTEIEIINEHPQIINIGYSP